MKAIFKLVVITYLAMSAMGCTNINEYLDKSPTGGLSDVQLFQNYTQLDQYIMNLYARLPYEWFLGVDQNQTIASFTYASVSDEGITSVQFDNGPHNFTNTPITPTYNPLDMWAELYASIRASNLFLNGIEAYKPTNSSEISGKSQLIAEAHFFRAWFHFELFKRYGGVPILDRLLTVTDDLNLPRNTAEEVVNFIVSDCDEAAQVLPAVHNASDVGRATKGAALMLKARALLYLASELHNPQSDIQRWTSAANAFQAVIDLNVYQVGTEYGKLFNERNTPNIIFQSTRNNGNWVWANRPPSLGGNGRGVNPSLQMVNAYEMQATGKGIFEPGSGYDPTSTNMYQGRDPRFKLSIVYQGATGLGPTNASILTRYGWPNDGIIPEGNSLQTQTGFYLRKTVDQTGRELPNRVTGSHFWIYMRYEDALLSYAEARNESLSAPDASVYAAVNAVRTRPGVDMPPLEPGMTKDEMRAKIRNERRVELAFEGQRFWDIRRWRIANDVMKEVWAAKHPISGNAELIKVADRVYEPHFDLFPIPQVEINRQPALIQNPGYN